ncbi:unnamed protein product [marine sediment metagenome]|uniref:Uncharacterized protein n=1 Tax=marine sediment metagenome TaxID=412755 RepID=X1ECL3_9ZZZZ
MNRGFTAEGGANVQRLTDVLRYGFLGDDIGEVVGLPGLELPCPLPERHLTAH